MSRELLQQALDALRQCEFTSPPAQRPIVKDAITALREALAAPMPEPVAWYRPSPDGDDSIFRDHRTVIACTGNKWEGFLPLYAAPPAAPAVPLTIQQYNMIPELCAIKPSLYESIVRAIEKAHGIGGGNG